VGSKGNKRLELSEEELNTVYPGQDIEKARQIDLAHKYKNLPPNHQDVVTTMHNICERIANGEYLTKIVKEKDQPCYLTVHKWLLNNESLMAVFTEAKRLNASFLAEQTLEIGDDLGIEPAHKKIMIGARQWYAGKVAPRVYGDSTLLKHADSEGNKLTFNQVLDQID